MDQTINPAGDCGKNFITTVRPECLVDLLEAVQIELQNCKWPAVFQCIFLNAAQCIDIGAAVGQTSQCIIIGQAVLIRFGGQGIAQTQGKLTRIDRLGQKVIGAVFQRLQLGFGISRRSQHNNRCVLQFITGANLLQNIEARNIGHHQVEQHNIRSPSFNRIDSRHRLSGR